LQCHRITFYNIIYFLQKHIKSFFENLSTSQTICFSSALCYDIIVIQELPIVILYCLTS